jgi:hypothetical protein
VCSRFRDRELLVLDEDLISRATALDDESLLRFAREAIDRAMAE